MTDDPELRIATSIMDYIFRRIAVDYMSYDERVELGILTQAERIQPTLPGVEEAVIVDHPSGSVTEQAVLDLSAVAPAPVDKGGPADPPVGASRPKMAAPKKNEVIAPLCYSCGNEMQRAGSCYVCGSCGSTSGCS
jgi:ribonucleoside-diphosphate reductase alpha chain